MYHKQLCCVLFATRIKPAVATAVACVCNSTHHIEKADPSKETCNKIWEQDCSEL